MLFNVKVVILKIANIVAVAKMNELFDLDLLASKLKNSEYGTSKSWLKMRLNPGNHYIAFYASGKFLVTGVKTYEKLEYVVDKVMKKLKESDINVSIDKIEVSNIVITDYVKLKLQLEEVIYSLDTSSASYEPEQFPGLFYKNNEGISFTLFASGKIIMTGIKNIDTAETNLNKFKETIENL